MDDREGGDRGMSPQDPYSRGDYRVGEQTRESGDLQVKILSGNAVLLVRGSVGAIGYDLCVAINCIIPSRG